MLAALLAASLASAHGAGLSVPDFRIITNGHVNEAGAFVLRTRVYIDLLVEGGAKFAAWFKLDFKSDSMEDYLASLQSRISLTDPISFEELAAAMSSLEDATGIGLKTAAIAMNGFLGTPLELAFFVGRFDVFCSGADFPLLFGTKNFATRLRGFMYYPDGIGGDGSRWYDGLHEAYGTGFRLSLPGDRMKPYLYLYQDSWMGAGKYSVDARFLFNGAAVKMELFAGATFPAASYGLYRAGFLFDYDIGSIGSFYAQMGIPRWDPSEPFGMDKLFYMFEPRIDFGIGTLTLSLFFHPAWYLQRETDEEGSVDARIDVSFGDVQESGNQGGLEVFLAYNPNLDDSSLKIEAAPYYQTLWNGVRWDLRLAVRAFPYPGTVLGMFVPSIGITTSY